jgi:uncharacterized protein with PQ loop repeat
VVAAQQLPVARRRPFRLAAADTCPHKLEPHEGSAMDTDLPVLAGTISTAIFTLSMLPMLVKAARTRELRSYSLTNLLLSNTGNVIHSVYVFHLPIGPIWVLHTFYLITTALMLVWYLRWVACRLCAALCSPQHRQIHRVDLDRESPLGGGRAELIAGKITRSPR